MTHPQQDWGTPDDLRVIDGTPRRSPAQDLCSIIGLEVPWRINGLSVLCTIIDCKRAYGKITYLIQPVKGSGRIWVREGLTLPTEGE